ncbi:MAG: transporter [Lentimicrobiaceae bacterium]|nr:transporter [Lentimicrobiaceae bacterium]
MTEYFYTLIHQPYFVLFAIIATGLLLGNISYKGFSFDVSAVIFVAMLFGHFGFSVPHTFQSVGLVLFIFTIGIQSGPGFFEVFLKYSRQLITLSVILIALAVGITLGCAYLFELPPDMMVGVFNGALTSTPGLAAAIDATGSPLATIGFGVTYPAGVICVILFVTIFPKLLKVDLKKEEKKYVDQQRTEHPELYSKTIKITNESISGKNLRELNIPSTVGVVVSRIKKEHDAFIPNAQTVLNSGDAIHVVGSVEAIEKSEKLFGHAIEEELRFDERYIVGWFLVTDKKIVSKSLVDLQLNNYLATVTRIRRSGIDLTPTPYTKLRFGDRLLISHPKSENDALIELLGNEEKRLSETNFFPIALGILIGILIGSIKIPLGSFDFSLGLTGGVLITAMILSAIGKTGPILWSISSGGNQLIRRFGLLLFMTSVGADAGKEMVNIIQTQGFMLIGVGILITVIPMVVVTLIAHYGFKLNMLSLLGAVTGAMTSTPGLGAIDSKTESDAPSIAYAAVYPAALILTILASQLLALLC